MNSLGNLEAKTVIKENIKYMKNYKLIVKLFLYTRINLRINSF